MNAPVLPALIAAAEAPVATRLDGWTGPRRRAFLESLAEGHTVEAACAHVGLSVASAYALRRRAGGEAFALGWRAACLLARDRLADILTSRAIAGQVETYTRADGQEVTRHRFDNRLAMGMLTRLDRLAEQRLDRKADTTVAPAAPSPEDPVETMQIVAADLAAFLDLVEEDGDGASARAFVEQRWTLRYPQLPQLRAGDAKEPEEDTWWGEDGWRTTRPPPRDFIGFEHLDHGDPRYWRALTRAECQEAERSEAGG